jgi:subtilase family serine protease
MNIKITRHVLANAAIPLRKTGVRLLAVLAFLIAAAYSAGAQSLPNLAPYQPQGWPDPLVISTNTGNRIAASEFYNDQNVYVDWACYNATSIQALGPFMVKIFVDGTNRAGWSINVLNGSSYSAYDDFNIGKLAAGTHEFRFDVDTANAVAESNESDNSFTRTIIVKSRVAPLTIVTTSPLAAATVGTAYTNTLQATGGTPPYTWSIASSNLPPQLSLNAASGLLSGTLTNEASLNFTVKVADAANATATNDFAFTVLPAAANPNLIVFQKTGWLDRLVMASSQNQIADAAQIYDDQDVYLNWVVKNEALAAATNEFGVQLFIDSQLKQAWTIAGLAGLAEAATTNLNIGKLAVGIHHFRIVVDGAGTVSESNEADNAFDKEFSILQRPNPPTITAQNPLPTGMKGLEYSYVMTAEGGEQPYSWSISGGSLPTGVVIDKSSGRIFGAPAQDGNFQITIKVAGANGFFSEGGFSLAVEPTSPLPNLHFYALSGWSSGVILSLSAAGRTNSTSIYDDDDVFLSWSIVNESPSVDVHQKIVCRLYIDNVKVQEWSFTELHSSSENHLLGYNLGPLKDGLRTIKLVIDPLNAIVEYNETDNTYIDTVEVLHTPNPLTILTASPLPDGTNGYPYTATLEATNGTSAHTWAILSGELPSGLTFNTNTGVIQGMPTVAGSFPFRVQVMASNGKHQEKDFELDIQVPPDRPNLAVYAPAGWSDPLVVTTTSGSRLTIDTAFDDQNLYIDWAVLNESHSMPVTTPFKIRIFLDDVFFEDWTYSVTLGPVVYTTIKDHDIGKLFSGNRTFRLVVDPDNVVDEYSEADNSFTRSITILPRLPAPTIGSPSTLPEGTNGSAYSFAVTASGGAAPYTWSLVEGPLPPGLTLSTNTGVLSGTPSASANYSMRIRATGANRLSSEKVFNLSIREPLIAPSIVAAPQPQGVVEGETASFTVAANGTQPLAYQWLKDGKTMADNDRIHGTKTPAMVISDVQASDAGQYSVSIGNVVKTITSPAAALTVLHQPASLGLQMYAGLMITGGIGAAIEIQYTPDMANTNQWLSLTNFVLPISPLLFIDTNSATAPKRFYRAVTKN